MWSESLNNFYFKDKEKYDYIYTNRFSSENSYHFNFNINGNPAFFFYHKDILKMISDIQFLDKKVESLMNDMPKVAKDSYIRKSLIDEVLYTNEIEGIISTRKEIGEIFDNIQNAQKVKPNKINSLINKYVMMLNEEHEKINSPNDIRKIYDELVLDEVLSNDEHDMPDGILFRANQVEVRNEVSGKIMHEGVMPEARIIDYLVNAINFLNDETVIPLIKIAAFHYIFSYVHPFYDGNGRTNRYISSLYLKKYYNSIISFRLSLTIKENKKQYYDAFDITNSQRNKADITTFIFEFLDIVKKAYETTVQYLTLKQNSLNEKSKYISSLLLSENSTKALWFLYQINIFDDKNPTIMEISNFLEVSDTTARKILNDLLERNLIERSQESRYKTYQVK